MPDPRPEPAPSASSAMAPTAPTRALDHGDTGPAAHALAQDRGADCAQCLRPSFTARLSQDLDRGAAVNLIAVAGQGATRLLADLQWLAATGQARGPRLVANLKRYRASLAGLTQDLWRQSGLAGTAPASFGDLCDRLEREAVSGVLLLDHFDALLANPDLDPGYDDGFLDALNALRNRGLGLVCVSARRIEHRPLLLSGRVRTTSTLDLIREDLPALMHAEVRLEITRHAPPLDAAGQAQLAQAVLRDGQPVRFLELALKRIGDGVDADLPLPQRLDRWQRELRRERRTLTPRALLRLRDMTITSWRSAGLDRLPWQGIADSIKAVLRPGGGNKG